MSTIIVNSILRIIVVQIVKRIGIQSESFELMHITLFVFLAQFINTGIMPILSTANFSQTPLESIPLRNFYKDFTEQWYLDAGAGIIKTMCLQAMIPYGNMFGIIILQKLRKWKDTGSLKSQNPIVTKSVNILEFVNNHAGDEVELPIQYSFIFNTIFVTFTYGLAMPILFVITFFTLINVYITETILFAYYYQKPPVYG